MEYPVQPLVVLAPPAQSLRAAEAGPVVNAPHRLDHDRHPAGAAHSGNDNVIPDAVHNGHQSIVDEHVSPVAQLDELKRERFAGTRDVGLIADQSVVDTQFLERWRHRERTAFIEDDPGGCTSARQ